MKTLWPLAVITFREGIRNRALYGIAIFALLLLAANQIICAMIPRDVGKVAVDISLSTVSFCGLLTVFFVGINLLAKDFDRKTIYMVLSRPISRGQYIWGKFFGMALLLLTTTGLLGVCAFLSVWLTKITYGTYFPRFSPTLFLLALVYITLSLLLLTAVSFFFSSFTSTSFLALIMTVICYLIGQVSGDVKELLEIKEKVGISVPPLVSKITGFAYYVFPNFSLLDLKMAAAHGLMPSIDAVFWSLLYGGGYTILVLSAAAVLFRRREFP